MPRPSDVYATCGAPGVYQATPCTPSRLPNVYVFPPEEDKQDVYCLFHSGSALPTTFESFYSHPVYTQRDSNSPTLTDLKALDHALSYLQRHSATNNNPRYGPGGGWEHEQRIQTTSCDYYMRSIASSPSSPSSFSESLRGSSEIEAETSVYSSAGHGGEAEGQREDQWQYQPNPPSRRSSVFGERPPDYEILEPRVREDEQPVVKKMQTMTFKSRAAMALKGLGNAMARCLEGQAPIIPEHGGSDGGPAIHDNWHEPKLLRRKRSLQDPLHSHVDIPSYRTDVRLEVAPTLLSSSVRDPKLVKRKSITQLFGLGQTFIDSGAGAKDTHPRPDLGLPAMRSSSSLASPAGEVRLSRRRSVTQLLGLGRSGSPTELSDHTIVPVDADETGSDIPEAPGVAPPRSLEGLYSCSSRVHMGGTMKGSQSVVSLVTPESTAPAGGRKSFLRRRAFSFLDVHRHTDHGSRPSLEAEHALPPGAAIEPSGSFSPDSLSEGTDSSSSVAASTECDQTVEDDMQFPAPNISAIMGRSGVALAKNFEPNLMSRSQLDLNEDIGNLSFLPRFRLEAPDNDDDVESDAGEEREQEQDDPPTLDFTMRLDSLTFDQLVFDPESFMGSVYD